MAGTPWILHNDMSMQLLNKASTLAAELKDEAMKNGKEDIDTERIMSMIGSYDGMKGKIYNFIEFITV